MTLSPISRMAACAIQSDEIAYLAIYGVRRGIGYTLSLGGPIGSDELGISGPMRSVAVGSSEEMLRQIPVFLSYCLSRYQWF
jgi:hypothetical protein